MRWTRLINSKGESLPEPVKVHINGIPAHAWELATAELILSDHCWIGGVHSDTADHRDVFRVIAWSSSPARIPSELDLEIVEPPPEVEEARPTKRTLVYPVAIAVAPVGLPAAPVDPPLPPPAGGGWRRHGRQRPGSSPSTPGRLGGPRPLVHERWGHTQGRHDTWSNGAGWTDQLPRMAFKSLWAPR
ncbi:unnamed protein product [Urochloa humidicola]